MQRNASVSLSFSSFSLVLNSRKCLNLFSKIFMLVRTRLLSDLIFSMTALRSFNSLAVEIASGEDSSAFELLSRMRSIAARTRSSAAVMASSLICSLSATFCSSSAKSSFITTFSRCRFSSVWNRMRRTAPRTIAFMSVTALFCSTDATARCFLVWYNCFSFTILTID